MNKVIRIVTLTVIWLGVVWGLPARAMDDVTVSVYAEHDDYLQASAPYGISWGLLELAAKNQKIKLVPQPGSWKTGLARLKAGKVDLLFAGFKTQEREKWALFTLPLITTNSAIYTRWDNPVSQISDIDFAHSVVGVSSNSVQEELAKDLGFQNIYATGQRSQFYTMVKEKRVDYLLFAASSVNYYCMFQDQSKNRDCLKQVGDAFESLPAHALGLKSVKTQVIVNKINSGLSAIKLSPDVVALFQKYNYSQQDLEQWQQNLE